MEDGDIDYSRYTDRELHEALAGIRRDLYPRNYANILIALSAQNEGAEVASNEPPVIHSDDPISASLLASRGSPLITITQRTRDLIFRAGIVLFIVGAALGYWAYKHFEDLPNYLRIAVAIPITTAYAMLRIDQYRDWDSVRGRDRGHAIGALIGPPLLLLGSLFWLITSPGARG